MRQDQERGPLPIALPSAAILWGPVFTIGFLAVFFCFCATTVILSIIPIYLSEREMAAINRTWCAHQCDLSCTSTCIRVNAQCSLSSKTIKIVTANDQAPFISQTGNNTPVGFNVDLMDYIASLNQINFIYEYKQPSQFISSVQSDVNTISISAQFDTVAREAFVDFAQFFRSGTGFLVQSNDSSVINGLSDLCGKKVAVLSTSIQQQDLQTQNTKCVNQIQIQTFASLTEQINNLRNGNTDVVLYGEAVLTYLAAQSNSGLKVVGTLYNVQPYGILCNKQNPSICCAFVNTINYLMRQGTYENLLKKYSFTYKNNGICPSKVNINGTTCISKCAPSNAFCQNKLS